MKNSLKIKNIILPHLIKYIVVIVKNVNFINENHKINTLKLCL